MNEQRNVRFCSGLTVAALGQGSWRLGQNRRPDAEEKDALRTGVELGLTLIDTAEMYGSGRSETLIGNALEGIRDRAFLTSKILPSNATSRENIRNALDKSLKRLKTDVIDLYLLHWISNSDKLELIVDAFCELREEGKIRAWGVSNFDVDDMERLFAIPQGDSCATNQVLYNLAERGIEYDLIPWAKTHNMPIMAYSPLGGVRSRSMKSSAITLIAKARNIVPAAIMLAWCIRNGSTIAIPEAGTSRYVKENAKALQFSLTEEELAMLDREFPPPLQKAPLQIR